MLPSRAPPKSSSKRQALLLYGHPTQELLLASCQRVCRIRCRHGCLDKSRFRRLQKIRGAHQFAAALIIPVAPVCNRARYLRHKLRLRRNTRSCVKREYLCSGRYSASSNPPESPRHCLAGECVNPSGPVSGNYPSHQYVRHQRVPQSHDGRSTGFARPLSKQRRPPPRGRPVPSTRVTFSINKSAVCDASSQQHQA